MRFFGLYFIVLPRGEQCLQQRIRYTTDWHKVRFVSVQVYPCNTCMISFFFTRGPFRVRFIMYPSIIISTCSYTVTSILAIPHCMIGLCSISAIDPGECARRRALSGGLSHLSVVSCRWVGVGVGVGVCAGTRGISSVGAFGFGRSSIWILSRPTGGRCHSVAESE